MNRYKVAKALEVHTADGAYGEGDEFNAEYSAEEEAAHVASGLLEIVPSEYKVIGGSTVYDTEPGEVFTAAIPAGAEAALVAGGHIERVKEKKKEKSAEKSKKKEGE